jgi:hypothetical protein
VGPPKSKSTNIYVREIRNRVSAYFNLVLRGVRDTVPKNIGHFLVRASQENIQFSLYSRMNKSEFIDHLSEVRLKLNP